MIEGHLGPDFYPQTRIRMALTTPVVFKLFDGVIVNALRIYGRFSAGVSDAYGVIWWKQVKESITYTGIVFDKHAEVTCELIDLAGPNKFTHVERYGSEVDTSGLVFNE
jgi:hypothetical protein